MSEEQILICPAWPGRNRIIEVRKISCAECRCDVSIAANNIPIVVQRNVKVICESCGLKLIQEQKAKGEPADVRPEMLRETIGIPAHQHKCHECGTPFDCYCDAPHSRFGNEFQSCEKCRFEKNPHMKQFFA